MKIYIIFAAIFFCTHALGMEHTNELQNHSLDGQTLKIIHEASGYNTDKAIWEIDAYFTYRKTYFIRRKCTLRRLLSPCRYLNPFRAKL